MTPFLFLRDSRRAVDNPYTDELKAALCAWTEARWATEAAVIAAATDVLDLWAALFAGEDSNEADS